jgi:hypothetical protein
VQTASSQSVAEGSRSVRTTYHFDCLGTHRSHAFAAKSHICPRRQSMSGAGSRAGRIGIVAHAMRGTGAGLMGILSLSTMSNFSCQDQFPQVIPPALTVWNGSSRQRARFCPSNRPKHGSARQPGLLRRRAPLVFHRFRLTACWGPFTRSIAARQSYFHRSLKSPAVMATFPSRQSASNCPTVGQYADL